MLPMLPRVTTIDCCYTDIPASVVVTRGEGDGTVNAISADVCLQWRDSGRIQTRAFDGVAHTALVRHPEVVQYILKLVIHANFAPSA